MESSRIIVLQDLIANMFCDSLIFTRKTSNSFMMFWNFSMSSDNDIRHENLTITMNDLPLFYIVVSLKDIDQISLKLIAYNGKLIDSTSICDTSEESDQYIFEFVQKLKTIRLCEGIKDFHPIGLDKELLSSYFVEQLDSRIFVRSQKCTFGIIEDGLDVCEVCTSVNDKRLLDFDEGKLVDENDLMKCDECPLQTKNPQLLKKHVRVSHSKNKPYMCQKCPFSSNKYLSIMRHIDRTHERTKDETDYNEKLGALSGSTIKPYACQYVCRQCSFKTTKSVAIAKHIRRSHEVKEPYKCEFCAKSFTNSGIMNVHVRSVHLKEKRYKCQDCSYESYVKHSVTKHIKYVHDKVRSYSCEHCAFAATTKSVLESHIKRVHEKIKPFSCTECSFKAATNYHLKRHVSSVHEKLKPYQCNQCEYKAAVLDNLSLHVKHVHDKIREHKCQYCSYETTRKPKLIEHINNAHGNTVLHVVENIHAIQVEQPDNIQIPIEGIELKFLDRVPGT